MDEEFKGDEGSINTSRDMVNTKMKAMRGKTFAEINMSNTKFLDAPQMGSTK
jgi:hypothetical protein